MLAVTGEAVKEIFNNGGNVMINGGLETTLIYKHNLDLPFFSCIDLFKTEETKQIMYDYYLDYVKAAKKYNVPVIIDTPTWRFNKDWAIQSGYNDQQLANRNKEAVDLVRGLKDVYDNVIISGELGPRYDGYVISEKMTTEEAQQYHSAQVESFSSSNVDIITAATMNYVEEALGVTLAAKSTSTPLVVSFTLSSEGDLPSGMTLKEAIMKVDTISGEYPLHYMINCVHPVYFAELLKKNKDQAWIKRIKGIRPNASSKSHEELDNLGTLDVGDMDELANYCKEIQDSCKHIKLFGGCCGTTVEHIECIYEKVK